MPVIVPISKLSKETIEMLNEDDKIQDQCYQVRSEKWLSLQLLPKN